MHSHAKKIVLVTGGSGFLGSWIITALLNRGYAVRATVRSKSREADVRTKIARHTQPLASESLTFVVADLLSDDGWDNATKGVDSILHTASPMPVGKYKGTDIIRPAREGTMRVLNAGLRAGVRRIVLTSSLQAALPSSTYSGPPTDETLWTDLSSKLANDYTKAKTLAEQDAWAFFKEHSGATTLTTILPGMVQGPVLGAEYSGSIDLIAQMMRGKMPVIPHIGFSIVDVRDLVELHLSAMESELAAGQRFVGSSDFLWLDDVARLLKENFGNQASKVSTSRLPDLFVRLMAYVNADMKMIAPTLGQKREFSIEKAERLLGWQARSASEAVLASVESLIQERLILSGR